MYQDIWTTYNKGMMRNSLEQYTQPAVNFVCLFMVFNATFNQRKNMLNYDDNVFYSILVYRL
jgi:hypothetical protein